MKGVQLVHVCGTERRVLLKDGVDYLTDRFLFVYFILLPATGGR